jgi:Uri superfamily endonuclease
MTEGPDGGGSSGWFGTKEQGEETRPTRHTKHKLDCRWRLDYIHVDYQTTDNNRATFLKNASGNPISAT